MVVGLLGEVKGGLRKWVCGMVWGGFVRLVHCIIGRSCSCQLASMAFSEGLVKRQQKRGYQGSSLSQAELVLHDQQHIIHWGWQSLTELRLNFVTRTFHASSLSLQLGPPPHPLSYTLPLFVIHKNQGPSPSFAQPSPLLFACIKRPRDGRMNLTIKRARTRGACHASNPPKWAQQRTPIHPTASLSPALPRPN